MFGGMLVIMSTIRVAAMYWWKQMGAWGGMLSLLYTRRGWRTRGKIRTYRSDAQGGQKSSSRPPVQREKRIMSGLVYPVSVWFAE